MATMSAMEIANKEMKKQYKNIDIDKIEVSITFPLLDDVGLEPFAFILPEHPL